MNYFEPSYISNSFFEENYVLPSRPWHKYCWGFFCNFKICFCWLQTLLNFRPTSASQICIDLLVVSLSSETHSLVWNSIKSVVIRVHNKILFEKFCWLQYYWSTNERYSQTYRHFWKIIKKNTTKIKLVFEMIWEQSLVITCHFYFKIACITIWSRLLTTLTADTAISDETSLKSHKQLADTVPELNINLPVTAIFVQLKFWIGFELLSITDHSSTFHAEF